ncbi:hypothetical protein QBC41DRAFT_390673 [Cercophora samala]|uniref:Cytochrome b561 domain-containing protein n=1 Tax=Cercophora samala TaxID=330535 RepID=A0AA39ZF80_9PEZI|nr:hypothetical protein QBC41DRAFT_390673 [Cercophora samala]
MRSPKFTSILLSLLPLPLLPTCSWAAATDSIPTQNTQYCLFGHPLGQADFCFGLSVTNHSDPRPDHDFHKDFHISLSVRRSSSAGGRRGWTAVGTGPVMAGSVMVIVYGEPGEGRPVVSVRSVGGHHQPGVVTYRGVDGEEVKGEVKGEGEVGKGGRVRVVRAEWVDLREGQGGRRHGGDEKGRRHDDDEMEEARVPDGPVAYAARVEVVCEMCDKFGSVQDWGGAAAATGGGKGGGMPWIWAWNDDQDFEQDGGTWEVGAKLKMHRHRGGSGGYGRFWVDMARAYTDGVKEVKHEWDFEEREQNKRVGTSDGPIGFGAWFDFVVRVWSLAKIHGVVMGVGFLGLFPLGVVMIRMSSGKGRPFKRHWRVQAVATAVAVGGAMIGGKLSKWHMPKTLHQWLGAGIVIGLVVQSVLGWRHHVDFVRIKRRTWISYGHIWLGRAVVAGGFANVVLGMLLSGKAAGSIWLVVVVGALEAAGLGWWLWRAKRQRKQVVAGEDGTEALALMPRASDGGDNYFALDESEEETSDEDQDGKISDEEALRKKSVDSASSVKKGSVAVKD